MAFPPLENSAHILVSVSIDFPINSKQDAPFHRVAYDFFHADPDGGDHLRDVPWEDIFELSASAAASKFCEGFRLEFMYVSLTVSIKSNLTYLHGFQLLMLLS